MDCEEIEAAHWCVWNYRSELPEVRAMRQPRIRTLQLTATIFYPAFSRFTPFVLAICSEPMVTRTPVGLLDYCPANLTKGVNFRKQHWDGLNHWRRWRLLLSLRSLFASESR
jgi:hypothetical protein